MEVNNHAQPIKNPPAFLERKVDPRSTRFMQALADAMEPIQSVGKKTTNIEPATLTRLVLPRSTIALRSLNPAESVYSLQPAALEKTGQSRIVPFGVEGS